MEGYEYIGKASYKGVEFIFVSSSIAGGKKVAEKELIQSDLQIIEELGKKQRSYSVSALVALIGQETDYIQKRDRILTAFESPGAGTLVHPIHGIIPNVIVRSWSLNESINDIGVGELQIDFGITSVNVGPVQESLSPVALVQTNKAVKEVAASKIESIYQSGTKLLGTYAAAKSKVAAIGEKFNTVTRFAAKQADSLTDVITAPTDTLANTIGEFNRAVVTLANAPKQLAASITNTFETINSTIATTSATFEVFKQFFGFGWTTDIELRFNTVANRVKNNNNRILNDTINGLALSYAYVNASQKDYQTTDEIDADIATLEAQFNNLISRPNIDQDFLAVIHDARETANEVFAQQRLKASSIINVDIGLASARSLAYQYYGDDSQANNIAKLNGSDGIILDETVKILTK